MHKAPLAIGLVIVLALLSIVYVLRDFITSSVSLWLLIILGAFALIFGLLLGIKFMSVLGD